jgi:hypothetical protein
VNVTLPSVVGGWSAIRNLPTILRTSKDDDCFQCGSLVAQPCSFPYRLTWSTESQTVANSSLAGQFEKTQLLFEKLLG